MEALSELSNGQLIGGGAVIGVLALVLLVWAVVKRLFRLAIVAGVILAVVLAYRASIG